MLIRGFLASGSIRSDRAGLSPNLGNQESEPDQRAIRERSRTRRRDVLRDDSVETSIGKEGH